MRPPTRKPSPEPTSDESVRHLSLMCFMRKRPHEVVIWYFVASLPNPLVMLGNFGLKEFIIYFCCKLLQFVEMKII